MSGVNITLSTEQYYNKSYNNNGVFSNARTNVSTEDETSRSQEKSQATKTSVSLSTESSTTKTSESLSTESSTAESSTTDQESPNAVAASCALNQTTQAVEEASIYESEDGDILTISEAGASAKLSGEDSIELSQKLQAVVTQKQQEAYEEQLEQEDDAAKEQGASMTDVTKIMEIARRISNGDEVAYTDARKVLDYSSEMYQMAIAAAMMNQDGDKKKYESMSEEEENQSKSDKLEELAKEQENTSSSDAQVESSNEVSAATVNAAFTGAKLTLDGGGSLTFDPGSINA